MKKVFGYEAVLLKGNDEVSNTQYFVAGSLRSAKATATRLLGGARSVWKCAGVCMWVKGEGGGYRILLARK